MLNTNVSTIKIWLHIPIYARHSAMQTYRQKNTCPTPLAYNIHEKHIIMRGSNHSCALLRETAKWLCKSSSNTCRYSGAVIQNWIQHFELDREIAIYEWTKNYSIQPINNPKVGGIQKTTNQPITSASKRCKIAQKLSTRIIPPKRSLQPLRIHKIPRIIPVTPCNNRTTIKSISKACHSNLGQRNVIRFNNPVWTLLCGLCA